MSVRQRYSEPTNRDLSFVTSTGFGVTSDGAIGYAEDVVPAQTANAAPSLLQHNPPQPVEASTASKAEPKPGAITCNRDAIKFMRAGPKPPERPLTAAVMGGMSRSARRKLNRRMRVASEPLGSRVDDIVTSADIAKAVPVKAKTQSPPSVSKAMAANTSVKTKSKSRSDSEWGGDFTNCEVPLVPKTSSRTHETPMFGLEYEGNPKSSARFAKINAKANSKPKSAFGCSDEFCQCEVPLIPKTSAKAAKTAVKASSKPKSAPGCWDEFCQCEVPLIPKTSSKAAKATSKAPETTDMAVKTSARKAQRTAAKAAKRAAMDLSAEVDYMF